MCACVCVCVCICVCREHCIHKKLIILRDNYAHNIRCHTQTLDSLFRGKYRNCQIRVDLLHIVFQGSQCIVRLNYITLEFFPMQDILPSYTFTNSHTHTHIRTHVHTYTRTHVHTYTRTHVHTYTRTHVH